jgi:hypothetical protein
MSSCADTRRKEVSKYLWSLWRDPWEVLERPLPEGLNRAELEQVRMIVSESCTSST